MAEQAKVPYSQLLMDLSKNQVSITEAREYVDHLKELKRSLDIQYMCLEKDVIHTNEKLLIADQRQQLNIIGRQKLAYSKTLLKEKRYDLKEKLESEVMKTSHWKKEMQLILSKHLATFSKQKAIYDARSLASQRYQLEVECKKMDIMVNMQNKNMENARNAFYRLSQIQEQMSRLHIVQMAKAYDLCSQSIKKKLEITAEHRKEKQEVEKLKKKKEDILKSGVQIASQSSESMNYKKMPFSNLSQPNRSKPSIELSGLKGPSPRMTITLQNIPRLQLPEWEGTPAKMPCLSSFTGTPYQISNPLTKTVTSTFSLFKSKASRPAIHIIDNTLKDAQDLGGKEVQHSKESSCLAKLSSIFTEEQNETSALITAKNADKIQGSPFASQPNSEINLGSAPLNQSNSHILEVQEPSIQAGTDMMEICNDEISVHEQNMEKEANAHDDNAQENVTELNAQPTEPHCNVISFHNWGKKTPEFHYKPFYTYSASKLNTERSSYFVQNTVASTNIQSTPVQGQENENLANADRAAVLQRSKGDEEKSPGNKEVSKNKDLQSNEDCIPCSPVVSPTQQSNSSGAALTADALSPSSYVGTEGSHSSNIIGWSPPNISSLGADGPGQTQRPERINVFEGTAGSSNQAFSLAFNFGSSTTAPSATTILFGDDAKNKQKSKDSSKNDSGNSFNFGFQPVFKMF